MKTLIFTLTKGSKKQGLRIKKLIPDAEVYVQALDTEDEKVLLMEKKLKDLVKKNFKKGNLLIFIMAAGIVVRTIAPLIKHKSTDPAILVMDEAGTNVISLLSGHLGGGNEWTLKIAKFLRANPVITTASDVRGVLSVDLFAQQNNGIFTDWELAKRITAHLVDGGVVGVYGTNAEKALPENYHRVESKDQLSQFSYGLIISDRVEEMNQRKLGNGVSINKGILQVYPINLVVGIGCRKDTPFEVILEETQQAFKELGRSPQRINRFATVDVKKNEVGLQRIADFFNVPLEIVQREEIIKIEENFETSSFVRETIGVSAVSGPCAFLASNGGRLILEKRRSRGITLSIAELRED